MSAYNHYPHLTDEKTEVQRGPNSNTERKTQFSPQILTEALQVGAEIRAIQLDTVIATLLCSDSQRQSQETTTQKHRTIHTVTQT